MFLIVTASIVAVSFTYQQQTVWKAPPEADNLVNPVKGDKAASDAGAKLFQTQCSVCHGTTGKGDGMAGANLTPRPRNLQSDIVKNQTDGAIFWKITNGRSPMPSFTNLSDKQRWQLVNYIRKLQTGTVAAQNTKHNSGMMHHGMRCGCRKNSN